ncbi:hypothetical protein RJ641_012452 [Dillenia turbinata]|uniref:Uncharacterized protein n=1 Tax=Dillenia turbinata TaxID=194707 RepID=A0AAN8Z420_9MAGN
MVSASLCPQSCIAFQVSTVTSKSCGRGTDAKTQKLTRIRFIVELEPSTNSCLLFFFIISFAYSSSKIGSPGCFNCNSSLVHLRIFWKRSPQLPEIDLLTHFKEENQKFAEFDKRFQTSPLLKELLKRSKMSKEKYVCGNGQAIQDKYCLPWAEWGVGDCSTEGMSTDERDNFIAMLKQAA